MDSTRQLGKTKSSLIISHRNWKEQELYRNFKCSNFALVPIDKSRKFNQLKLDFTTHVTVFFFFLIWFYCKLCFIKIESSNSLPFIDKNRKSISCCNLFSNYLSHWRHLFTFQKNPASSCAENLFKNENAVHVTMF